MGRRRASRGSASRIPAFAKRLWFIFATGAYAAVLVGIRGRPSLDGDPGIFLSVAGRLLQGDRLYVDVLDNKDPLFFYSYAVALSIGDWRAPFLLDVIWVAIAAVSAVLFLRAIGATRLTAAIGFLCLPLLLTWAWYFAGSSMLAALALAPLIGWLWIRGTFALAGALLCVGLLFKANLILVLVSAPVALLMLGVPAGAPRSQVARAAAGFGAALAAAVAILALRGELHGYFEVLIENVSYSRDVLEAIGRPTGILGHIRQAAGGVGDPWQFVLVATAFLLGGLLAIWTLSGHPVGRRQPSASRTLAALFLFTSVATSVTLALTAAWWHHSQMLAYPGFLLITFLVILIQGSPGAMPRVVAACGTTALAIALVGGTAKGRPFHDVPISTWFEPGRSQTAELLERAAEDRLPELDEITFAHLGGVDEQGVAAFLGDEFVLACPEIAQYVFSPDLSGVLDCIRDEKPRLLLVTPSFRPQDTPRAEWGQFVAHGSNLLKAEYERALEHDTGDGSVEVWALEEWVTPSLL